MSTVYGYCRISTKKQSIERQERNIKQCYPMALIVREVYTGTKFQGRKELEKIISKVKSGDTIVFDSVSRMSRNAEEGVELYFNLYDKGVNLVFLKEAYINSDTYAENLKDKIELNGSDEDEIFKGLNNYFRKLAEKQIRIAFEQSEKEVSDLKQRTKEGLVTARLNGKHLGQVKGSKLTTKKSIDMKERMLRHLAEFGGTDSDKQFMTDNKIARNTFYKYKAELKAEKAAEH